MYIDDNGNIAKWLARLTIVTTVVVVALVCSVVATIVSVENQVPSGEELIKDDNVIFSSENGVDYIMDLFKEANPDVKFLLLVPHATFFRNFKWQNDNRP